MSIIDIIKEQYRIRLFEESVPRIIKVLSLLTIEEIWQKPNQNSNSIGNLVLHLCGNVTQWIGAGIGRVEDQRDRNYEFENKEFQSKEELIKMLKMLETITLPIIQNLSAKQLTESRNVQCYSETVLSIIIHVIEHFSYHTGQIAYAAKYLKNEDLGFYVGLNLNKKN